MFPDVMVEIPEDLESRWQVQLRPGGRRVIATIREGRMQLRSAKNGNILEICGFSEELQVFGRETMLDGVWDEITGAFFVMDVLFWDSAEISACEAECRHFWLSSRFSEISNVRVGKITRFCYIKPLDATSENISAVYNGDIGAFSSQVSFQTDSLLFMHKEAVYTAGLSPLFLQWRDANISKYTIDTNDKYGKLIPPRQAVVLKVKRQGSRVVLKTWDGAKVADCDEMLFPLTFRLDESSFLVRGYIDDIVEDEGIALVNLTDIERVTSVRVFPDSLARIRSQAVFRKHNRPIVTIESLTQRFI